MPHLSRSHLLRLPLILASLAIAPAAIAQGMPAGMGDQLAQFSGAMHATATACGSYSEAELAAMKSEQKSAFVAGAVGDAASFERAFAKGEAEGKRRWESLSAPERNSACKDIESQANQLPG